MKKHYRYMLSPLSLSCLMASLAMTTQAQQIESTEVETTVDNDRAALEEVIVTGSYIKGSSLDAPSPVQVIDRASIEAQGAAQIWDVIKNLEINSGSTTNIGSANEGGGIEGTANINLRNLGQNATLTLINGKRQVASATTTRGGGEFVDINSIPTSMVDRIEVLTDGGSALYGSDAVAGVVNIIMRTDFEGAEIYGDIQKLDGAGSLFDSTLSGIWGWASASGDSHFVLSGEYFERDPVPITSAAFYDRDNAEFTSETGGDAQFTPFNFPFLSATAYFGANLNPAWINTGITDQNNANRAAVGLGPQTRYTDPLCGSSIIPFDTFTGTRGEQATSLSSSCRQDTTRFRNIANAEKRQSITSSFNHEFSDSMELYSLFQYSENEIQRFDSGSVRSLGPQTQLSIIGSHNSNPVLESIFGPGIGEFMTLGSLAFALGNPAPNITNAPNSLANGGPNVASILGSPIEILLKDGNDQVTESLTAGAQIGLRGDFTIGGKSYDYDVSYSHSSNDFEQNIRVVQRDRMELAINGLGGPGCTPNGTPNFNTNSGAIGIFANSVFQEFFPGYFLNTRETISQALTSNNQGIGGCEFFNPFLSRLDPSRPELANSPELLAWLTPTVKHVNGRNNLDVFDAVVSGDLFELSSGTVQFAAGVQMRDQQNRSQAPKQLNDPSLTTIRGYDPVTGLPNASSYVSNNLGCSLCIQTYDITRDVKAVFTEFSVPLADSIETQIALRYEDYGGGIGAELSPKIAISWRPIDSLLFRGSYSQSFRAPNVAIVFQGYRASSNRGQDILSAQEVRAGVLPPVFANAEQEQVFTLGRPSPDLGNETADTFNIGVQWTPESIEGLSLQADFWRFELQDAVVPQPVVDALAGELELFTAAAADPNNYVLNATLEPGQILTACDPNALATTFGPSSPERVECVVNPATYQIVGVQRALNSDGNLITAVIGAVNAGEIISDGVDLKAGYRWDNDLGNFYVGLDYTFVNQYQLNGVPGLENGLQSTGRTDAAGTTGDGVTVRSLPDNKGHVTLGWNRDEHSISTIVRYIGSYDDLLAPGVRADANAEVAALVRDTIDSYTAVDFQYNYSANLFDQTTVFTFGVLDLFEQDVPYRETGGGLNYDTNVFDGRGRRIYVRALIQFD